MVKLETGCDVLSSVGESVFESTVLREGTSLQMKASVSLLQQKQNKTKKQKSM